MERLAIIGTGISGLGAAYLLNKKFEISLFEKNSYVGGHTNTISVAEGNTKVNFDTGFMVFNKITYPNLLWLFNQLGVDYKKTDMSFSVQHKSSGLEYCGAGLNGLFGQRKNIFNPRFIKMLIQINRFNKNSIEILNNSNFNKTTLQEFVEAGNYGNDFLQKYLVPMSSAVWSTPPHKMLKFPVKTLIRFFFNHGFLGLNTQHQWYTVCGGSKNYIKKILKPLETNVKTDKPVSGVKREGNKIKLTFTDNSTEIFDKVLFASHADQTLKMLLNPTSLEANLLKNFRYQKNIATVHTDETVMPLCKNIWSSWNYKIDKNKNTSTIYWMNNLQGVSDNVNYFVSIDDPGSINSSKIIKTIEYEHPLFSIEAIDAQKKLHLLNKQQNNTFFCGSYFRYGFHEDAFTSAMGATKEIIKQRN